MNHLDINTTQKEADMMLHPCPKRDIKYMRAQRPYAAFLIHYALWLDYKTWVHWLPNQYHGTESLES